MKTLILIGASLCSVYSLNAHPPLSELQHRYDNVAGAHDVVRTNKKGKGVRDYVGREKIRSKKNAGYRQRINNRNIRMQKV